MQALATERYCPMGVYITREVHITNFQWYEVIVQSDKKRNSYTSQVIHYYEGRQPYGVIVCPFGDNGFQATVEEAFIHAGMFIQEHSERY